MTMKIFWLPNRMITALSRRIDCLSPVANAGLHCVKDRQDCWSEYHRRSRFPIHSITDVLTHEIKQGTVYTVDHWSMEDKKSRTREEKVAADGNNIFGGALSAVRAQCNYLGVWPY